MTDSVCRTLVVALAFCTGMQSSRSIVFPLLEDDAKTIRGGPSWTDCVICSDFRCDKCWQDGPMMSHRCEGDLLGKAFQTYHGSPKKQGSLSGTTINCGRNFDFDSSDCTGDGLDAGNCTLALKPQCAENIVNGEICE